NKIQDDVLVGVLVNADANWQFSRMNRLTLGMTMGFDQYLNHPEGTNDSQSGFIDREGMIFQLSPGSALAFDFSVGDVMFTVYERATVRPGTGSEFQVENEDIFGSFQNDIGLGVNWAINSKLNLSLNYNRSDTFETTDEELAQSRFNLQERRAPANAYNRAIDTFSGSLAWTPEGTYTVGLEGSISKVDYEEGFNNDATTLSGGVFVVSPLPLGKGNTTVRASAGWQNMDFDTPEAYRSTDSSGVQSQINSLQGQREAIAKDVALRSKQGLLTAAEAARLQTSAANIDTQIANLNSQLLATSFQDAVRFNGSTQDASGELDDYYYNVTLANQLNARFSHQISVGHESSLNVNSNFITADYVSYGAGLIAWRGAQFSFSAYYEDAKESGGRLSEDVEQWGLDGLLTHRLTDRATVGLGYHYGNTDSAGLGRDYDQNAYTFDVNYMLTKKMSVRVGYRYLTTESETESQSFDQNRVTLSMSYNF
ncbi:MAG: outer membrane beta-barrel protein, partial [Roseimicrobium sp.]